MDKILKIKLVFICNILITIACFSESKVSFKDSNNQKQVKPFSFQGQLEFSGGYSTRRYINWNLRTINGVAIRKSAFIGIGVGLHNLRDQGHSFSLASNYTYIPVFIRFSIKPLANNNRIFIFSDFGTQFKGPNTTSFTFFKNDPIMFKPLFLRLGTGTEIKSKKNIYFFTLSYKYNKSRYFTYNTLTSQGIPDYKISDWFRSHTLEATFGLRLK